MSIGVHRLNRVPTKKIRFKGQKKPQTKKINRKKVILSTKTLSQSRMHCCYNMYNADYYLNIDLTKDSSCYHVTSCVL